LGIHKWKGIFKAHQKFRDFFPEVILFLHIKEDEWIRLQVR
jgi:hypothetical protein